MNSKSNILNGKHCSICGKWYQNAEFNYGNRENRSYCRLCDKAEKAARTHGGLEGARKYREEQRAKWKK